MLRFFELFVLPFGAIFFPWGMYFRGVSWLLSRTPFYFKESCLAYDGLSSVFENLPPFESWQKQYRLTRFTDHADLFLRYFRGAGWFAKYVSVEGTWPQNSFVALSFHWGAGLWFFHHLRRYRYRAVVISAVLSWQTVGKSLVQYGYAWLRTRQTARCSGCPVVFVGGARKIMLEALREGKVVFGTIDVSPFQASHFESSAVDGYQIRLPSGFVVTAQQARVPVVLLTMSVDCKTGSRVLHIGQPMFISHLPEGMQEIAGVFYHMIRQESAQWHLGGIATHFFSKTNVENEP